MSEHQREISPRRSEADLFGLLASSVSVAILEALRNGGERTVSQMSLETRADAMVIRRHVMAMQDLGLLRARVADPGVWCGAVDTRVYRLLELAAELLSSTSPGPAFDADRRDDLRAWSSHDV